MNVEGTYQGKIAFPTANEGPFDGIIAGGKMTVVITYDPSQVPASGVYAYHTNNGNNGDINIALGNLNLNASMDNSKTMGWPIIQFKNAQFIGAAFAYTFSLNGGNYQLLVNGLRWEITNTATHQDVASGSIINQPK
jgi:hypothetical protein